MKTSDDIWLTVKLHLASLDETGGEVHVSMCEKTDVTTICAPVYANEFNVERLSPHVVGAATSSGKNIHLFIQEMATA